MASIKLKFIYRWNMLLAFFRGIISFPDLLISFMPSFIPLIQEKKEDLCVIGLVVVPDQYHLKEFLEHSSVFVDIGAHMGAVAEYAATLCGEVYAFEPTPQSYKVLSGKAKKNSKIHPFNIALGSGTSDKQLLVYKTANACNRISDSTMPGSRTVDEVVAVKMISLDSFVEKHGISPDFIKIDTEGYEEQIPRGAAKTIQKFRPVLAMAAYHHEDDEKKLASLVKNIEPAYRCVVPPQDEKTLICEVSGQDHVGGSKQERADVASPKYYFDNYGFKE